MNSQVQDHALEPYSDTDAIDIEDHLWWLQGRKAIIRNHIELANHSLEIRKIVDVGCGSGGSFDVLSEFGEVIGVDRSDVLVQRARARGIASAVHQADATTVLSQTRDVQLITMFDVLEHIEHDSEFLRQLNEAVSQKHLLLISVPAGPFLYSDHDKILHHYRRYSKNMLRECLGNSGYRVIRMNYFMFFLFPAVFLERMLDRLWALIGRPRKNVNLSILPGVLNQLLLKILRLEAGVGKRISFPIGLWLFALAERKE